MRSLILGAAIACAVLFCGVAQADTVTLSYTYDYTDGGYFAPPDVILDHPPFYRGLDEDWGWTQQLVTVPSNATGIVAATLSINAWDVDYYVSYPDVSEIDVIYVNGVEVGILDDTGGRNWVSTTFDLPESVLDDLWNDGEIDIYMDIDIERGGSRVTLGESVLNVTYTTGAVPEPATIGLLGIGALLALKRRRSRIR